ncbi:MAG: NUDIX hydrolase [Gammaproteobacteria bacterium]|nr:NUDIX hydrolase [Gammaproteobacteria bacterium]
MTKNQTIHFRGRFLGLTELSGWEYAFRTNASGVVVLVPVTNARELVLVEQYRIPVQSRVVELPAGLVGDHGDFDEDFKTAAQRELLEETGFSAATLDELLTSPSTPGMSDEIITIYYASGLERVGPGGGDVSEDITVHVVPLDDAPRWLEEKRAEGIMVDPKVFAGLYWAASRSSSAGHAV